ncbi:MULTISPECIES: sulfite oxidase heme-binding subunit YedZ [unclassified Paludibacterium]|uniref:sulfite oxidase heme-binding subunit YedZ n=1 Tax=unclassified Paludibacterium TaxID=2618429 RepID=UPI001C054D2A|nr:protein-methionine-sulfoxide reductase heme-binding subunit MsrQ [Paludibacterium sp. B53371]BEV73134.1 protein-methionine-sulfoxide reductase heme-binding subunit MsrQ [Paludibacterium sp. THUN1379]
MQMTVNKRSPIPLLKGLLFVLALLPLLAGIWQVGLGDPVDPVAFMTHASGDWALRMLLLTLAITPLRRLGAPGGLLRFRRMLGLFAFFYAMLHFSVYLVFDKFFDVQAIAGDIYKRPFITVGFAALVLMLPLAITSTDGWIRRLKRRWGMLHRLVYAVAILGVTHYWWLVKRDIRLPLMYAAILAGLLGLRVLWSASRRWQGKVSDVK